MAVVLLTHAPELATDNEALRAVTSDPAARTERDLENVSVLDLCAGSCTVAAAASQLGALTTAIDIHPIAVLIGKATLVYPAKYSRADPSARGSGARSEWAGLAEEVAHWSGPLLERTENDSGDLWLAGVDGVMCDLRLGCPSCGHYAVVDRSGETPGTMTVRRGEVLCPDCKASFGLRKAHHGGFEPQRVVRGREMADPDQDLRMLLTTASYPAAVEPFLDEPFVFVTSGPISVRDATTPRQARVIRASQEALRSIRNDLADAGYAPERSIAILTYLALGLGSLVDLLSTCARWNDRRRAPTGLDRGEWYRGVEFFEVGGAWLRSVLRHRFADMQAVIESNGDGTHVDVRTGDMTDLSAADASFDLVIWDPPFYDNIAYDRVALPWTRFLRSTIGDLDPSLCWPSNPSREDRPPSFDRYEYDDCLRRAAVEVSRVLRPNGRLGVFWTTKEVADLAHFLEILEPAGLELVQSLTLGTESRAGQTSSTVLKPILLVFRRTSSAQPSDAAMLLEGDRSGLPMMTAGLVALLEQHLDDDEISDIIPRDFKGTRSERLAEAVLTAIDPLQFLRRFPKRVLKSCALERGCRTDEVELLDREGLANLVFRLLGWRSPQEAPFTIGRALDDAAALNTRLRLARDDAEIRGLALAALDRLEQVLRFSVVSWATRLQGEDWDDCLQQVAGKRQGLTFGQWFGAFRDLPGHYAGADQSVGRANARLRRAKVLRAIDSAVIVRNQIAHHEEDCDWLALRDGAVVALDRAIDRLRAAESSGGLPRVLQPVSEVRDPYGRITLRLVGHAGHYVEYLMTESSDLTLPMIILPGDTNPREVDPVRVDADAVSHRAGLA